MALSMAHAQQILAGSSTPCRSKPRSSADAYADLQSLLAMQQQQKQAWEQMLEAHSERAFEKRRYEGLKRAFDRARLGGTSLFAEKTGDSVRRSRFKARWAEWRAAATYFASSRRSMRRAVNSLRRLGERRGLNAWREIAQERSWQQTQLKSLFPENRKMRAAWNSWAELREEQILMRRSGASLMLQGQRKCLNAWKEMAVAAAVKKQGMMRVVASIRVRGSRQAWNAWAEMAAELAAAKR